MMDMDHADRFFEMVEAVEVMQAEMIKADGDIDRILAIAARAGFELRAESLIEAAARRAALGPAVDHAAVYLASASEAPGHPEIYLAEAPGHPAVYLAEAPGHPAVYLAEAPGHPAVYLADAARAVESREGELEPASPAYAYPIVYLS